MTKFLIATSICLVVLSSCSSNHSDQLLEGKVYYSDNGLEMPVPQYFIGFKRGLRTSDGFWETRYVHELGARYSPNSPAELIPIRDARGSFEIRVPEAEEFTLFVKTEDCEYGFIEVRRETLQDGERALEIALDRSKVLYGFVHDAEGQPIPGAQIFLGRLVGNPNTTPSQDALAMTDESGLFRFTVSTLDVKWITARRSEYGPQWIELDLSSRPDKELDFTLYAAGMIDGVVRTKDGNLPAVLVRISAGTSFDGVQYSQSVEADRFGRFQFTNLPHGTMEITYMASGENTKNAINRTAKETITLAPGEKLNHEFELPASNPNILLAPSSD